MAPVEIGSPAPDFTLLDQQGNERSLKAERGRPVVLFFYPKDMTSGCTVEACDFRDLLPRFERSKARVFGISILGVKSKAKFADKEQIDYPLLADDRVSAEKKPDPEVAQAYGVWVEKSMYGKKYMGIQRTTFVIDARGDVAERWDKVKVPGHAEAVLEAVRSLD